MEVARVLAATTAPLLLPNYGLFRPQLAKVSMES